MKEKLQTEFIEKMQACSGLVEGSGTLPAVGNQIEMVLPAVSR